jgi:hypothetical protein
MRFSPFMIHRAINMDSRLIIMLIVVHVSLTRLVEQCITLGHNRRRHVFTLFMQELGLPFSVVCTITCCMSEIACCFPFKFGVVLYVVL